MSTQSGDERTERDWATAHFREYLLGRLNLDDAERLTTSVALLPGLIDDLEYAEEELIEAYLDARLAGDDRLHFEREYVRRNDQENWAKLRLHQALRSPELRRELAPLPVPERPALVRMPPVRVLGWVAVAASLAAIVLGTLYLQQSWQLAEALAALKLHQGPLQPGPRVPRSVPPTNLEQPAGLEPDGGLILPAPVAGTATVRVSGQPTRLTWSHVSDYRKRYRFRVYAANGEEITSPLVTPRDNAIAFSPGQLPLPWDVFISAANEGGAKVLAHYVLVKP